MPGRRRSLNEDTVEVVQESNKRFASCHALVNKILAGESIEKNQKALLKEFPYIHIEIDTKEEVKEKILVQTLEDLRADADLYQGDYASDYDSDTPLINVRRRS